MGYFKPIELSSADYFGAVVAHTERQDRELRRLGPVAVDEAAAGGLLLELCIAFAADGWRIGQPPVASGHFDELDICVGAPLQPRLRQSLGRSSIDTEVRRVHRTSRLSAQAESDIRRLLLALVDRPIGILCLRKNRGGWCWVEMVERST